MALGGSLLAAPAAHADTATTIVVNTTQDLPAGSCGDTQPSGAVSLRMALCVADNVTGPVTVQVPAGTYPVTSSLSVGAIAGADITIEGTGGQPVLDGGGTVQLLVLDPNLAGNVSVTVDGVAFENGAANDNLLGGGGAIVGGSGGSVPDDSLTVIDSTFRDNSTNTTNTPPDPTITGGAIFFGGGALTVKDSTFTDNTSNGSSGGAISYVAAGWNAQTLTVSGSTFSGNSTGPANSAVSGAIGGGAIQATTNQTETPQVTVSGSTFTGNSSAGSAAGGQGGAIMTDSGILTVTSSTLTDNAVTGSGALGAAISADTGSTLIVHYDRIAGNTGAADVRAVNTASATANWWGCNAGPGAPGCSTVDGLAAASYTPWLQLHVTADPTVVSPPRTTSTITADLLTDSDAGTQLGSDLGAFSGASVAWTHTGDGSLSLASSAFSAGTATTTYTVGGSGAAEVTAQLDGQSVSATVDQTSAPVFTSASSTSVASGGVLSFPVTTTGSPAPALSISGEPSWVSLSGATLTGNVPAGTTGDFTFTLKAANGVSPDATQEFTLTVTAAPVVTTSPTDVNAVAGDQASFSAAATGYPAPTVQWQVSTDGGTTYVDVPGATSDTLSFTSDLSQSGNRYRAEFTNGTGTVDTAAATLSVGTAPQFTSGDSATFKTFEQVSFAVTAEGTPTPTITATGLPSWLSLDSTNHLVGTPPTGSGGVHSFTLTAANGIGTPAVQPFTLTLDEPPAITLDPQPASVNPGTPVTFTAAASGYPAPTVQWFVSTDGGQTYTEIPNATDPSYTFTPTLSDDGNLYQAAFTNSVGVVGSTPVALTVGTAPTFTSANATEFSAGGGTQSFPVTVAGHPVPSITATGLPAWLSLSGSTLTGEPPAGSGGLYSFTLHASNTFGTDITQNFTLTVTEAPEFTSQDAMSTSVGTTVSFPITTGPAYPALTGLNEDGALPDGLSFVDNGDGTGLISGIPLAGSGGVYPVTITTVGGSADTVQHLTVTVEEAPTFTSPADAQFTRGVHGTFTVTASHAYPQAAISVNGTLPTGLTFTDNGDGTATIAGMTTDAATTILLSLTAANGVAPDAAQAFVLTVRNAPVVPLPTVAPFGVATLGGVPATVAPSQVLTVTGGGFAPFATITLGFYSTPTTLGTVAADASGAFTTKVTVPADALGHHTIAAAGTGSNGDPLYLSASTTVVKPGGSGSNGAGSNGAASSGTTVANTGLPEDAVSSGILAALAVLLGALALAVRAVRRRRA